MEILAQALSDGPNTRIGRGEIISNLYGRTDDMLEMKRHGDRLRAMIVRIRKLTGCDEFVMNERESNNSSWYSFGGNPTIMTQE